MKTVYYFLSHPIQYQSPLLKLIEKEKPFNLKVLYFTDHTLDGVDTQFGQKIKWDVPLLQGYDYSFLKNYSPRPAVSGSFWGLINPGLIWLLLQKRPDYIIVHGWAYFSNLLLLLTARVLRIKVIMRAESPWKQEKRSLLKNIILKYFVDKAIYLGEQNKSFYLNYGMKESKLFFAPYCVENDRFSGEYEKLKFKRESLRTNQGYKENDIIVMFSGKFIDKKRPMDLLKAFRKINDPGCKLLFVGEGYLRKDLELFIKDYHLSNSVRMTGFINQSLISEFYSIVDIFVLPSGRGETWGLVLNEAMNFHLPLVVSDMVGSSDDLVKDKLNGYTYRCGDVDELAEKLNRLISKKELRVKMGDESAKLVKEYSYNQIISGLKKAVA